MKKTVQTPLKKVKIVIIAMLAVELLFFVLPINVYGAARKSMPEIGISIFSLGASGLTETNVIYLASALSFVINVIAFACSFLIKKSATFRNVSIPFYLSAAIISGFCWGAITDLSGFARALYSFSFINLVTTVVISVCVLGLADGNIVKKEL